MPQRTALLTIKGHFDLGTTKSSRFRTGLGLGSEYTTQICHHTTRERSTILSSEV